jgi:hypothetical protein
MHLELNNEAHYLKQGGKGLEKTFLQKIYEKVLSVINREGNANQSTMRYHFILSRERERERAEREKTKYWTFCVLLVGM